MAVEIQKLTPENLDGVSSILILCWGLLGDVFIRVPLIEAVRKRFPKARIVVVVDPVAVAVLENHPDCDEIISFSRKKRPRWRYLTQTLHQLLSLRRQHFDICIDLYAGGSSPRFSRIINAETRISFGHTEALRRANNVLVEHPSFSDSWSKALGTMLGPLGLTSSDIRQGTSFYCSASAIEYAHRFVEDKSRPLVAFNLGAGASDKRWPVECFAALAREINRRHGFTPLVFTNPGMEELAEEFSHQYGDAAVIAPLLSLERVAALMLECDYVVTGDTSLMHMVFGLKRPTLALFTYTRPEMVMPEDCLVEACFVESDSGHEYCGKPAGSVDIPVAVAVDQFEALRQTCARLKDCERVMS